MSDDAAELARIEHERERREDELLILILALMATARRDAAAVLTHGADPGYAIQSVVTGTNGFRGVAPLIARTMAQAHRDGYRRAGLMAGTRAVERADAGTLAALVDLYMPGAREAAAAMAATLVQAVYEAVARARSERTAGTALRRTVRDAFDTAGYTKYADHGADLATERAVVGAHNVGIISAAMTAAPLQGVVTGLEHWSVIDEGTTDICFAGSTRVTPIGGLLRVHQRRYEGEMLVVGTAAGNQIHVTPNHPVLTACGWLPAKELKPREHVVYAVGDSGCCVECAKHVGMPPTFAELADAAFDPTVAEIQTKRATAADFHGDGNCGDSKVNIARINRHLMRHVVSGGGQGIGNDLLRSAGTGFGVGFAPGSRRQQLLARRLLSGMTTQGATAVAECIEYPASATPSAASDFDGTDSIVVQSHSLSRILSGIGMPFAPADVWHDTELAELASNSRGGALVLPCQRCGRRSVTVLADNVVDVRREFSTCHVFNLESSRGCYIADGLVVKNCRERHRLKLPVDHPYWRGNIPGLHYRCRSGVRILTKPFIATPTLPQTPPMPGFGSPPPGFLEGLMRRAA